MSGLGAWLQRLTKHESEEDDRWLREASAACGATCVADCRERGYYTVRGVVTGVSLPPASGSPCVSAYLYDGSGYLTLRWMGRREIPGIHPGVQLTAEGRVCRQHDELMMTNPTFHVLAPGTLRDLESSGRANGGRRDASGSGAETPVSEPPTLPLPLPQRPSRKRPRSRTGAFSRRSRRPVSQKSETGLQPRGLPGR